MPRTSIAAPTAKRQRTRTLLSPDAPRKHSVPSPDDPDRAKLIAIVEERGPPIDRVNGMQADRSHLPLKINTSGVIPPIFASSLLLLPATVMGFLANANLPSGAASLEPLNMFAPMPIGIALLAVSLAYFHFFGSKLLREDGGEAVAFDWASHRGQA